MGFIVLTYICVLVSGDSDELGLGENEGLSFGREEGVLRAVLLHLHHVETGLVLVQRLEDNHLSRRHVDTRSEHKATPGRRATPPLRNRRCLPGPGCCCRPCCWSAWVCWTTLPVSSSELQCSENQGACTSCFLEVKTKHKKAVLIHFDDHAAPFTRLFWTFKLIFTMSTKQQETVGQAPPVAISHFFLLPAATNLNLKLKKWKKKCLQTLCLRKKNPHWCPKFLCF